MSTTRFTGVLTLAACVWLAPALVMAASSTGSQGFGHVHALLVHPKDDSLLVGTHHGLFRSHDAGATWTRVTPKGHTPGSEVVSLAMHAQQYDQIFAAGPGLALLRSDDFGQTWQTSGRGLPRAEVQTIVADAHKPQQLYAWVAGRGLHRSQDGARSWHQANDGPPVADVRALASVNVDTGMGGIFIYAAAANGVFKSTD
jgi:photosystem II stability/assembly factor-like uncharacterized protein